MVSGLSQMPPINFSRPADAVDLMPADGDDLFLTGKFQEGRRLVFHILISQGPERLAGAGIQAAEGAAGITSRLHHHYISCDHGRRGEAVIRFPSTEITAEQLRPDF